MVDTRNITCYIKPTLKGKGSIANLTLRIDDKDITATTDDKGIATFQLDIANNELAKHIYFSIDSDEYVLDNHNHCVPLHHTTKPRAFPLSLNLSIAIESITMYKKEHQDNQEIQKEIVMAQVDSHTQTPQEQTIYVETTLKGANAKQNEGKLPKIQYSYIVKSLNEPLPPISQAKALTFTSHTPSNRKISFNLNTKFTYTITENNTQKETTDYLKDNQQLIILAHTGTPAYTTHHSAPHTILTISQYPILELSYGTARLIMQDKEKNKDFTIKHSIMPYLITHFDNIDAPYTITKKDSHLLISNANNKTFEIHKLTQESTQQSSTIQSQSTQEDTKISIDTTTFDNLAILTALLTLNENDKVSLCVHLCYKITLDMLKEVFEYNIAKDNTKTKMDTMLPQMVEELNRMQDNKPMYMHYNLDTRARLEHFFAQCYVEVGGSAFKLEEGLYYHVRGLVHTFSYYFANKERIKEALNDGRATKPDDYNMKDILDKAPSKYKANITKAIKDLVSTNATEIEKTLKAESKKNFDSKKAYSPIELIESFKEYQSYLTIQLAFRHSAISLAQGTNYEIPYSTESNKAFILIAQAIANHIVNKRSDKKAKDVIIANKVYGGKYGNAPYDPNLTDQTQGDGYKYRGKGLIHLTWKENYKKFGEYATKQKWNIADKDYFFKNPLILKNEALQSLRAAVYFWNHHKLYALADTYQTKDYTNNRKKIKKNIRGGTHTLHISINKSLDSITYKVNAGKENIEGRQDAFNRIRFGTYNITQAQLKSVATDLTELIESDENLKQGIFSDFK